MHHLSCSNGIGALTLWETLLAFKCSFNSLFSLLQAEIVPSHSSAPGGCGVSSCRLGRAPRRGPHSQHWGRQVPSHKVSICQVHQIIIGFMSRLQNSISEESNEVTVHLIFCTWCVHFYLLSLEGCTRIKRFEAENVLISRQYVNPARAGCVRYRGGHCSTSHGGGGSPAKLGRDVPCLSWEHWHLNKEILVYLNSRSSRLSTESQGCELLVSALEEDFFLFCILCL